MTHMGMLAPQIWNEESDWVFLAYLIGQKSVLFFSNCFFQIVFSQILDFSRTHVWVFFILKIVPKLICFLEASLMRKLYHFL